MLIIANIILLVGALFGLCVMLRYEIMMLRQCGYKNGAYLQKLNDDGEFTSIQRLLNLAILIGACTTMARMSWMVVLILAAVLFVQAFVMMRKPLVKQFRFKKRQARLYSFAVILTLVFVAVAGYVSSFKGKENAAQIAAMMALLVLVASPVLLMLVNWLICPIERRINKGKTKNND